MYKTNAQLNALLRIADAAIAMWCAYVIGDWADAPIAVTIALFVIIYGIIKVRTRETDKATKAEHRSSDNS